MNPLSIKDTLFLMLGVALIIGFLYTVHQPAPVGRITIDASDDRSQLPDAWKNQP